MAQHVTISPAQLRDLELSLAGVGGGELRVILADLEPQSPNEIELADSEGTPIAALAVTSIEPVDEGQRGEPTRIGEGEAPAPPTRHVVTGRPSALRDFGHRARVDLRATEHPRQESRATVVTGQVPPADDPDWARVGDDTVVVVLDRDDPRALAEAIRGVERHRRSPVVLPSPSVSGRTPSQWLDVVTAAAQTLIAGEVGVWQTPVAPTSGGVVLLTGLSGSGKSTISKLLVQDLVDRDDRTVSLLDGDEVRLILSSKLGFSREDRMLNVRRIGWVAALVAAHGGIAVCAPIAPYEVMRTEMRDRVEEVGRFLLVHVDTPLDVCEQRDRKGLYAKARAGEIPQFTGISDPYEIPRDADLTIDTSTESPQAAVDRIIEMLHRQGDAPHRP